MRLICKIYILFFRKNNESKTSNNLKCNLKNNLGETNGPVGWNGLKRKTVKKPANAQLGRATVRGHENVDI